MNKGDMRRIIKSCYKTMATVTVEVIIGTNEQKKRQTVSSVYNMKSASDMDLVLNSRS